MSTELKLEILSGLVRNCEAQIAAYERESALAHADDKSHYALLLNVAKAKLAIFKDFQNRPEDFHLLSFESG